MTTILYAFQKLRPSELSTLCEGTTYEVAAALMKSRLRPMVGRKGPGQVSVHKTKLIAGQCTCMIGGNYMGNRYKGVYVTVSVPGRYG